MCYDKQWIALLSFRNPEFRFPIGVKNKIRENKYNLASGIRQWGRLEYKAHFPGSASNLFQEFLYGSLL